MIAANFHPSDFAPSHILSSTKAVAFSRRVKPLQPTGARAVVRFSKSIAETPPLRPAKGPVAKVNLAEIFALKRAEKPPENFLPDFLDEFRRRNYASDGQPS